jgi:hypothetical protein
MNNFEPLGLKVRESFGGRVFGHLVLKGYSNNKFFKYFHQGFLDRVNFFSETGQINVLKKCAVVADKVVPIKFFYLSVLLGVF